MSFTVQNNESSIARHDPKVNSSPTVSADSIAAANGIKKLDASQDSPSAASNIPALNDSLHAVQQSQHSDAGTRSEALRASLHPAIAPQLTVRDTSAAHEIASRAQKALQTGASTLDPNKTSATVAKLLQK